MIPHGQVFVEVCSADLAEDGDVHLLLRLDDNSLASVVVLGRRD
jgi:hypothetical protein